MDGEQKRTGNLEIGGGQGCTNAATAIGALRRGHTHTITPSQRGSVCEYLSRAIERGRFQQNDSHKGNDPGGRHSERTPTPRFSLA